MLSTNIAFKGQQLDISRARKPKIKHFSTAYQQGATKIFVGAIPCEVTLDEFKEYFQQYGPISDICLPVKDKAKGINRGHGFVTYVYPFSVKLVIEQYKDHYIRAKWVI